MNTKSIALALFTFFSISVFAQMRISINDLPQPAQDFIATYFQSAKVLSIEKEFDDGRLAYEVKLTGNSEIDFDSEGNWKEVSGRVPADIIPAQIAASVRSDFKNKRIVKIERHSRGGYEIELSNGTDVHYDQSFRVISIDR